MNARKTMLGLLQRVCAYIENHEDIRNFSEGTPGKKLFADVLKEIPPLAEAERQADGFYILSLKNTKPFEQLIWWWRPNSAGYCLSLDEAGIYTKKDVQAYPAYFNNGDTTLAIPVPSVRGRSVPVVRSERLVEFKTLKCAQLETLKVGP